MAELTIANADQQDLVLSDFVVMGNAPHLNV